MHLLLYISPMERVETRTAGGASRWAPQEPFKLGWQADLWGQLFDTCLNERRGATPEQLGELRAAFERHLSAKPTDRMALKRKLCRQNVMLIEAFGER